MTFQSVVDNWMAEIQANVAGLDPVTIPSDRVHKYAAFSRELLYAERGERHLALFPTGDGPESVVGLTTQPSDLATESYTLVVWEDATTEATRLYDDDVANAAWIALYEAIRDRFYITANVAGADAIAGAGTLARYTGGSFDLAGTVRFMNIRFTVQVNRAYA